MGGYCMSTWCYLWLNILLSDESVKDLAALILSMEHIPNVVIYDKSYRIPKQLGDVTTLGWTMPHAGCAAERKDGNIKLSKSQTFDKKPTHRWKCPRQFLIVVLHIPLQGPMYSLLD